MLYIFVVAEKKPFQKHTNLFVQPGFLEATVHLARVSLC